MMDDWKNIAWSEVFIMSLYFCYDIQMAEFGINKMKTWTHSALYQRLRLLVMAPVA